MIFELSIDKTLAPHYIQHREEVKKNANLTPKNPKTPNKQREGLNQIELLSVKVHPVFGP
jgi:hypothetical protein